MDRLAVRLHGRRTECEFLDAALAEAREGRSRVVVLRGEAGAGKSVLLNYAVRRADGCRVATAVGIESEMELAYSGLHQLCAPVLDHVDRLPQPQRDALLTVFGRQVGPAPNPFLVGLATLTLLAEVAEQQPLLCVIDDAQWLDTASAQVVQFVGRRLLAERIALVCAARPQADGEVLAGMSAFQVAGLGPSDARALLLDKLQGRLDAESATRSSPRVMATRLPCSSCRAPGTSRTLPAGSAFQRVIRLPPRSSRATPRVWRRFPPRRSCSSSPLRQSPWGCIPVAGAVEISELDMTAAGPAVDARLLDVGGRIEFAHPLVRSAAYGSAADENGGVYTAHWPKRLTPIGTRTGAPGIGREARSAPTRRSPPSSRAPPAAPRPAAETPRRPPFSSARRSSRQIRRRGRGARSRRRRPSIWPALLTPPRSWSRRRPPARSTRSRARWRPACRARSPCTSSATGRRWACSSTRRCSSKRCGRRSRGRRTSWRYGRESMRPTRRRPHAARSRRGPPRAAAGGRAAPDRLAHGGARRPLHRRPRGVRAGSEACPSCTVRRGRRERAGPALALVCPSGGVRSVRPRHGPRPLHPRRRRFPRARRARAAPRRARLAGAVADLRRRANAADTLLQEAEAIAETTRSAELFSSRLTLAGFRGDRAALSMAAETIEPLATERGDGMMLSSASTRAHSPTRRRRVRGGAARRRKRERAR